MTNLTRFLFGANYWKQSPIDHIQTIDQNTEILMKSSTARAVALQRRADL